MQCFHFHAFAIFRLKFLEKITFRHLINPMRKRTQVRLTSRAKCKTKNSNSCCYILIAVYFDWNLCFGQNCISSQYWSPFCFPYLIFCSILSPVICVFCPNFLRVRQVPMKMYQQALRLDYVICLLLYDHTSICLGYSLRSIEVNWSKSKIHCWHRCTGSYGLFPCSGSRSPFKPRPDYVTKRLCH